MKLHVMFDCIWKNQVVVYTISPAVRDTYGLARLEDRPHFKTLLPRIEGMARRILGDLFISLIPVESGAAFLQVKAGTSTAKRSELRELLGWIGLFDSENDPPGAEESELFGISFVTYARSAA